MENHSETINNEDKEIKKKVFDNLNKVFKVFDKDLFKDEQKLENTEEDLSNFIYKKNKKKRVFNLYDDFELELENTDEHILENLLYINKYLIKKKNNLRIKIYRKIFYLKKFNILNDYQEFKKAIELFEDENEDENEYKEFKKAMELFEDEDKYEYQEFKKLVNKYYNLNKLTKAIKFYENNIKNKS